MTNNGPRRAIFRPFVCQADNPYVKAGLRSTSRSGRELGIPQPQTMRDTARRAFRESGADPEELSDAVSMFGFDADAMFGDDGQPACT